MCKFNVEFLNVKNSDVTLCNRSMIFETGMILVLLNNISPTVLVYIVIIFPTNYGLCSGIFIRNSISRG